MRAEWRARFHRGSWERDLEDEVRSHLEARVNDLVHRGLTREEALRRARIEFGSVDRYREECRQAHGLRWVDEAGQDLRYVLRAMRHSPGFAAAAIVSLALGIGANSVVFSVVNALVLKPLPVERPAEVYSVQPGRETESFPNYRDLRDRNRTLAGLAGARVAVMSIERGGVAERAWGYLVTGNYFDLLGVRPALGTFFHAADDVRPGAAPYAVLSYGCWRSRFFGDPQIAGRQIRINGLAFTVMGVAPRGFQGTELFYWPDIWVPMMMQARIEQYNWLESRGTHNTWLIGRLRPGISRWQAAADLSAIYAELALEYPNVNEARKVSLARPGLVGDSLRAPVEAFTGGLMVLSALVLLAVCANLASLLAARAADRSRELAIRLSIGAGRGRILRQLLTESLVLAAAGGLGALGLALTLARAVSRWRPPVDFPGWLDIRPDWRVFAFSAAAALVAGVISGIAPARQAWRSDPNQMLKGSPARGNGPRRLPLRDLLVGLQVAICCALVACCFVSIRGMARASATSLGLQPRGAAVVSFDLGPTGYAHDTAHEFKRRAAEAVARIPGVTAVGFANTLPLSLDQSGTRLFREETADFRPRNGISATYFDVSPGYLRAAGTRLLAGRDFTSQDGGKNPRVAIVNQRLARLLADTENAVGRRFRYDRSGPLVEIVGVVEDGKYQTLTEDPTAALFRPSLQAYDSETVVVARSSLPEPVLAQEMRRAVAALDPDLPLYGVASMSEMLGLAFLPSRAAVAALSAFGILALTLAITGIYGVSAYAVSRRVREIGIRVALGAQPRQVLACVLHRLAWLLLAGSCAGLALAWLAARLLASIVYQASPRDPAILGATVLTLAAAALCAALGPARRALGIDPAGALRHE